MIVGIVGSRLTGASKYDVARMKAAVDVLVNSLPSGSVVVTGGAKGVDTWAEDAARARGLSVIVYKADWKTHGKRAGMLRNRMIVSTSEAVYAFWDGRSPGTKCSIDLARKAGIPLVIVGAEN